LVTPHCHLQLPHKECFFFIFFYFFILFYFYFYFFYFYFKKGKVCAEHGKETSDTYHHCIQLVQVVFVETIRKDISAPLL